MAVTLIQKMSSDSNINFTFIRKSISLNRFRPRSCPRPRPSPSRDSELFRVAILAKDFGVESGEEGENVELPVALVAADAAAVERADRSHDLLGLEHAGTALGTSK